MNRSSTCQRVRDVIEATIRRMGFDLVAVEIVSGRRPVLRLSVDGPGGITIDQCARISHRVSPMLDEDDPIATAYELEVSSPGIDRPVQRLTDFVRFIGFRARVLLEEGPPRRRYTGTIEAVDGDDISIRVDGELFTVSFVDIEKANLVLDLIEYERLAALPWHISEGEPPLAEAPPVLNP